MNINSLEQAVADFNKWKGAAKVYYDVDEKKFSAEVFGNDIQAVQTVGADGVKAVFNKGERIGNLSIGQRRKEFIVKVAQRLDAGEQIHQIEYDLAEDLWHLMPW